MHHKKRTSIRLPAYKLLLEKTLPDIATVHTVVPKAIFVMIHWLHSENILCFLYICLFLAKIIAPLSDVTVTRKDTECFIGILCPFAFPCICIPISVIKLVNSRQPFNPVEFLQLPPDEPGRHQSAAKVSRQDDP